MKTILLISRCPPYPLHYGDRLIIWHLARELAERGYVIDLLALYDKADDPGQIDEYRRFFRHIELFAEPPRSSLAYLRRLLLPGARFAKTADASFCPPLWRAIASRLGSHRYDLAHVFGAVSVYEHQPLFAHLPSLITPYESYALYLRSALREGQLSARLRLPVARRFEEFMFAPYDRAVVISAADQAMLHELRAELAVELIPNGIELKRFQPPTSPREPNTLLFVGNYAYAPNQDAARYLIERLLPRVRRAIPAARLQLVGSNPPAWLRAMAGQGIEVSGHVPDVAPYLAKASLFVCPLRFGAGMKNKALEALAMGMPVLATPLSVDGIDVVDGQSVALAERETMADRTVELLHDADLRARLGRQGRALVEAKYSWTQVADMYERLYAQICAG